MNLDEDTAFEKECGSSQPVALPSDVLNAYSRARSATLPHSNRLLRNITATERRNTIY